MSRQVGFVAELIALEAWCFDNVLQHAAYILVHILDVQAACLDSLHNVLGLSRIARHHEVVACLNLLFCRQLLAFAYPVGHHNALISPLIAQNGGEQVFVALGIDTIDDVIRRHQRPGVRLAYRHLEAFQIEFAQGPLGQSFVNLGARRFL